MNIVSHLDKWQQLLTIVKPGPQVLSDRKKYFQRLIFMRFISENVLTFLLQLTGLMLTGVFSPYLYLPVWLNSGTACAFIFMRGVSVLPGIFLGEFSAYYLLTHHLSLASLAAIITCGQAFLLLHVSYRFISPTLIFYKLSTFLKFVSGAFLLTTVSALNLALYYFSQFTHGLDFFYFWLSGTLGNFNGIITLAVAIIAWDFYFAQLDDLKTTSRFLLISCYSLFLLLILSLFLFTQIKLVLIFSALIFSLFMIISIQFKWCGTALALLLFALCLNFAVFFNAAVFSSDYSFSFLLISQSLLALSGILGLSTSLKNVRWAKHSEAQRSLN